MQASASIKDTVQPAYRELLTFMRKNICPGTRTTLAAYDLPDGKAYYRAKIRNSPRSMRIPRRSMLRRSGSRAPA